MKIARNTAALVLALIAAAGCSVIDNALNADLHLAGPRYAIGRDAGPTFTQPAGFRCTVPLTARITGGGSDDRLMWAGAGIVVRDPVSGDTLRAVGLSVSEVRTIFGWSLRAGSTATGEVTVTGPDGPFVWRMELVYVDDRSGRTRTAAFASECRSSGR